jgi:hypothetical protein
MSLTEMKYRFLHTTQQYLTDQEYEPYGDKIHIFGLLSGQFLVKSKTNPYGF